MAEGYEGIKRKETSREATKRMAGYGYDVGVGAVGNAKWGFPQWVYQEMIARNTQSQSLSDRDTIKASLI
jgi:hypothetical protein